MQEKNDRLQTFLLVAIFGLFAVASRFLLIEFPNFKPVAAIAIFLGFYCCDKRVAVVGVLAIMLISDLLIGFYSPVLMLAVYCSILFACVLGGWLNHFLDHSQSKVVRMGGVSIAALAAALIFFLATNVTVVFASSWYPNNLAGVIQSLAAGLPFFKYTLAGNLLFALGIFSTYFALIESRGKFEAGSSQTLQTQEARARWK